jgi:hypothetical protein
MDRAVTTPRVRCGWKRPLLPVAMPCSARARLRVDDEFVRIIVGVRLVPCRPPPKWKPARLFARSRRPADIIEVYSLLPARPFFAAADEARRRGLDVVRTRAGVGPEGDPLRDIADPPADGRGGRGRPPSHSRRTGRPATERHRALSRRLSFFGEGKSFEF